MSKKTALDDNASIYQTRKKQTELEKLHDLPPKKRFTYLWEYYHKPTFIILAALALVIYTIYEIITPKPKTLFYAALVDNTISAEALQTCKNDFAKYLNINSDMENININSDFYLKADDSYAINMQTALTTYIAAKQVDVIIAPESTFTNYASHDTFSKLSDQLPADLYNSLSNDFFIATPDNTSEKSAYGVYLTKSDLFKNYADNTDPYVLGIVVNSQYKENASEFLRYLFHMYSY
jgi:hypothetical protein